MRKNYGKTSSYLKTNSALSNFHIKGIHLSYEAYKQSNTPGPRPLIAASILLTIGSILLGIIQRKPVIPILGFVLGWILFAIWDSKWKEGKIKFSECNTLMLGSLYLAIIGIIVGVILHSFLIGLFSVIAGIVLLVVGIHR